MVRRRLILVFGAGATAMWAAGLLAVPSAGASLTGVAVRPASVPAGAWGRATWVPGLGVLNKGGDASVGPVSCTSAGNCVAGGHYADRHRHSQGFVVSEKNGRWGRAMGVPGLGALNQGGGATVLSVSCTSAGNCVAGGYYADRHRHSQGFVVSEKNGRWGRAMGVPGLVALNLGGQALVLSVSCGKADQCAAGGDYTDGDGHQQGFVASEKNGRWGQAIQMPGQGIQSPGGSSGVSALSCRSAGRCAAVGGYSDSSGDSQGFVASEKNGQWGQAIEVPGLGGLNQGGDAFVYSVSCASAGSCAAGGDYTDSSDYEQGFVASEKNGRWGQAIEVPGLGAMNDGTDQPMASVSSVSCASPGNCTVGGAYGGPYSWAFLATERNGVWGQAFNVPGLGAIVTGRWAYIISLSCVSPGNCAAGGDYENAVPEPGAPFYQGFVVSKRNGRWDQAMNLPGLDAMNKDGYDGLGSVSCGSPGRCTADGDYTDRHGHVQGFVTRES